jgi:MoxR-like ATPase
MLDHVVSLAKANIAIAMSAPSSDELHTFSLLVEVAFQCKLPLFVHRLDTGFQSVSRGRNGGILITPYNDTEIPASSRLVGWDENPNDWRSHSIGSAVNYLNEFPRGLFVFVDLHEYLAEPLLLRLLKTTAIGLAQSQHTRMVMLGQSLKLPEDLRGTFREVTIPLPIEHDRRAAIASLFPDFGDRVACPLYDDPIWPDLLNAAATLTLSQIRQGAQLAAQKFRCFDANAVAIFHQMKIENLRLLGVTVSEPPDAALGGLDQLSTWVDRRAPLFQSEDPLVPQTKGVLLVGCPGTGKSLAARVIGQRLKVPVFKLESQQLLGSLVGESERKTAEVLQAIERAAPGVLWMDEIEKMFAGAGKGSLDSGVGDRIFGQILTFLQENRSSIFVVATANDVSGLPPELLRKGRFDEVFFIDLPNTADRQAVLEIHLARWSRDLTPKRIAEIASVIAPRTDGWVGAELAQLVQEAAIIAAARNEPGGLTVDDIHLAQMFMVPLAKSESKRIAELRAKCSKFVPANAPEPSRTITSNVGLSL